MIPFNPSLPDITKCEPLAVLGLGEYLAFFVEKPTPLGADFGIGLDIVEYIWALTITTRDHDMVLIITAEKTGSTLRSIIKDATNDNQTTNLFLCAFDESGAHLNIGSFSDLENPKSFLTHAIRIAKEKLNIDSNPVVIQTKIKRKPQKSWFQRLIAALNPFTFSRKYHAAWNALMAAYTYKELPDNKKTQVILMAEEIESSAMKRPVDYTEITNEMNSAQVYHLFSLAMMNCKITPALGKELWFEVKNPHIDLLNSENVIASTKLQLEKQFNTKFPDIQ